jgi:hypothetical protein
MVTIYKKLITKNKEKQLYKEITMNGQTISFYTKEVLKVR